jgi:hypothetical protein
MMFRTAIAALGVTALLAACGGEPAPAPSLLGMTVLNNDAAGSIILCTGGIEATATISTGASAQTVSTAKKVNPGEDPVVVAYTTAFINQIRKGEALTIQSSCFKSDGALYSKKTVKGVLTEDYKATGSNYTVTVNGTLREIGGYSTCRATDVGNLLAPCIVGGPALGLEKP